MLYRLIVLTGPLKGQRITVDPEPMTIGRADTCDIVLPDNEVAFQHARLEHRQDELLIRDLGSMNKVILNKREVRETRLKHGDIVELGRTRLLVEALVQAEVQHPSGPVSSRPHRKRRRRHLALAALTLFAAGIAFWRWLAEPPAATETDATDAAPVPASVFEPAPAPEPASADASTPVAADAAETKPASDITAAPSPLDDELRRIREDLQFIQQHINNLNQTAPVAAAIAEPAAGEANTAPTGVEARSDDLDKVLLAIQQAIDAADFNQADMMLEHVQLEYPDYLPAYELRAELYENWGMPGKAREQWAAIIQRTTESDMYRRAIAERIRLSRAESQRLVSAHEAVRIQSVEQFRFRESEEYDEMRLVKVRVQYNRDLGPVDPAGVRLLIYFFEQDMDTRRIELSALQPYNESQLKDWLTEGEQQFTYSTSYVVPKGYYAQDHNTRRQRYFGFIARLHYFDRLVDEQARPPKLLEPAILEAAGLALHTAGTEGPPAPLRPATN